MMERLSGWTIFSLRGVDVKIHVSLLFLLLYVVIVATGSFPLVVQRSGVNPLEMTGSPVLWASAFAVALVVSIFVHEFSHVLVAQSKGVKVRQITLMMLGGAAQMEKIPEEPMSEFKVAIIGPIVSLAIAFLLYWVRSVTNSPNIAFFSYWVGHTNLVLAVFNLLPAFPMDGGRVLRAFLVTKFGRLRGTQMAVQVSHVFAWVFGLIGFFYFNFILLLIAFFIYGAAKSELFVVWGQTILKGLKVKDIVKTVPALSSEKSVSEAVQEMTATKQLILPVSEEGKSPSIITADIINRVPRNIWNQTLVKDIAISTPKVFQATDNIDEILPTLLATPGGAIPVMESNSIIGIIRVPDLIETIELQRLNDGVRAPGNLPWSTKFQHSTPT